MSQQLPKDRLDGQLSDQINMLSDPVTNLRRRRGLKFAAAFPNLTGSDSTYASWGTSIGDMECHVFVNSQDGYGQIVQHVQGTDSYSPVLGFSNPYLVSSNVANICTVVVGDELFFINKEQVVTKAPTPSAVDPRRRGFIDIIAGAFNKKYEITVTNVAGVTRTFSYTTPAGTSAGDANLSTPQYIASDLAGQINLSTGFGTSGTPSGSITASRDLSSSTIFLLDAYVLTATATLQVTTTAGRSFVTASGSSYIPNADSLPAAMPTDSGANPADGYVVATGSATAPVYYKYVASSVSWLEVGDYLTSTPSLVNTPFSIRRGRPGTAEAALVPVYTEFEGRYAGDDVTNPDPAFVGKRITGVGSFEGRLVLLVGNTVCLSSSGKPRRFYRSTVTGIIDSDTIGIAASAAQSAQWTQSVEYGKDLLLFSSRYQGVIAGGSVAVTPRTAAIRVSSSYAGDVGAAPVNVGRTVLFMKPVSDDYFGVMEMVASQYADGNYTAYDSTAHLPRYMSGRCRLAVSSPSANMAVFLSTTARDEVVVHEYTWQGDTKQQQAWHKWKFAMPVATAYFSGSRLHLVFVHGERVVITYIDPRSSTSLADPVYNAPLDFSTTLDMVNGRCVIPSWAMLALTSQLGDFVGCTANGPLASEPILLSVQGSEFVASSPRPDGPIIVGIPYTSLVEFTPPMLKDHNGVAITTNKTTVLRFILGTNGSRAFDVSISDVHPSPEGDGPYTASPLTFSSTELELGEAVVGGPDSSLVIPARTLANSTRLIVQSEGTGDLNVVSLEYVMKTKEQIQRKKG